MYRLITKVKTAMSLGAMNLYRAISYRAGVKLGLNPVRRLRASIPRGDFFAKNDLSFDECTIPAHWQTSGKLFSNFSFPITDAPPDWHTNHLTGVRVKHPERDWWLIPDFDPEVGDIKLIWELSRFDWVLAFALQVRSGNPQAMDRLNRWLSDWVHRNPPYKGPNWKCGQEASIRVMHLAMASVILEQSIKSSSALTDLIELHLKRIAPTISYAMAQDNNHGTSEAAALFIGGSWLAALGRKVGVKWAAMGRKWLENRAARLIGNDGSFSQYSLNYHRVLLDTLSMVELWRCHLSLPEFSLRFQSRAKSATHWLHAMTNHWNGDSPNLGANDGARLLPLTDTNYRDCRPSVQLATALFAGAVAYPQKGQWDDPLCWLGLERPKKLLPELKSEIFDDGGFALLREGDVKVMLRYPCFRFRPSQADALHVDLWLQGRNLLRDAGTYSYNTEPRWLNYFPGTKSHNTIQFDDRDQMPRLSRFLFGDWLKTCVFKPLSCSGAVQTIAAGYKDGQGAYHTRTIELSSESLCVIDKITGFKEKAVLRWRLEPGDWQTKDGRLTKGFHSICVEADVPIKRYKVVQGWESRYYQDKQPVPVLEIEVNEPGILTTEYRWFP